LDSTQFCPMDNHGKFSFESSLALLRARILISKQPCIALSLNTPVHQNNYLHCKGQIEHPLYVFFFEEIQQGSPCCVRYLY
jgi:hypothetical protein